MAAATAQMASAPSAISDVVAALEQHGVLGVWTQLYIGTLELVGLGVTPEDSLLGAWDSQASGKSCG